MNTNRTNQTNLFIAHGSHRSHGSFSPPHCVNVFSVYRPTVFSGSRACSATLFAVSRWKRARSRAENYSKQCKAEGFLKILLGVFIVFVKTTLNINPLSSVCQKILEWRKNNHPSGRNNLSVGEVTDPLYLPLKRGGPVCPPLECPYDIQWSAW